LCPHHGLALAHDVLLYCLLYCLLLPFLYCSAALCEALAAAKPAGLSAFQQSGSNKNSSSMASIHAQSTDGSSCKQQQPGITCQEPGLQVQSDDAMLEYMQRLEEHRKRCELSGR
jgi:hypothetical protein